MARKRRSVEFERKTETICLEEARRARQEKRLQEKSSSKSLKKEKVQPITKPNKKMVLNKKKLIRTLVFFVLIVLFAVYCYNLISVKLEERALLEENERLLEEKNSIEKEIENVNTPEYMEEKAREKLKMVMPGEIVFLIPEEDK